MIEGDLMCRLGINAYQRAKDLQYLPSIRWDGQLIIRWAQVHPGRKDSLRKVIQPMFLGQRMEVGVDWFVLSSQLCLSSALIERIAHQRKRAVAY
jgi:hypothetical protein